MKSLIYLPVLALAFSSCATQGLYLNVTQPAPVTIAPEIKTVGIIDRSNPTDQTKTFDLVEKILTLEGTDLDEVGTGEAIRGVTDELKENDRFSDVRFLRDFDFKASNIGVLPMPLTWDQVRQVCNDAGVDALFALEMYDTDTRVNYSAEKIKIKTPLGEIPGLEHIANMETLVKTGWRIYCPGEDVIADEYIVNEAVVFSGRGINPAAAVAGLLNRKEAVKEVSNKAGRIYASRLLPYRISVDRDYYVKGTDNFKIAKRKARLGKWDEAGDLWQKETGNPRSKIAGRACYNMAIINEINGNLDSALEWAQRAYEDYRNRLALRYSRILENRKYNNQVLSYQQQR